MRTVEELVHEIHRQRHRAITCAGPRSRLILTIDWRAWNDLKRYLDGCSTKVDCYIPTITPREEYNGMMVYTTTIHDGPEFIVSSVLLERDE